MRTKSPTGSTEGSAKGESFPLKVEAKVLFSRLLLLWERAWPELWIAFALAALYFALSLFGLWSTAPLWLHAVILLLTSISVVAVLIQAATAIKIPSRNEALRRLEQASGFEHRPLIAAEDKLASASADAESKLLWSWHRKKAMDALARISWPKPKSDMPARDPFAIRAIAALLLVAGFIVAGTNAPQRLADAFDFDAAVFAGEPIKLDAWVTPPGYTGKPPIILAAGGNKAPIVAPENSELLVRVQGPSNAPNIGIESAAGDDSISSDTEMNQISPGIYEAKIPLGATVDVDVTARGGSVAKWTFAIVKDEAPTVALVEPIDVTERKSLSLHYKMEDDYGIATGEMRVTLDKAATATTPPASEEPTPSAPAAAKPEEETLVLGLPLPRQKDEKHTARAIKELLSHPWAGLPVVIQLAATDEAGKTGLSEPVRMVLPERIFKDPLARALIEQRKSLIVSHDNAPKVASVLDALTYKPEKYMKDEVLYLGMKSAQRRLERSKETADINEVRDLLYDLALRAEDGTLSIASNDLRELMEKLAEALKNDASDEEIAKLMDEVREAMNRYLEQMTQQAQIDPNMLQEDPNSLSISPKDLEQALKAIEEMSKSGARDSAQELLSQLQNLMENLQTGQALQMTPQEQAMNQAIQELDKLIEKQRQLMDETFQGQTQQEDPRLGEEQPGKKPNGKGLSQDQEQLRKELGDIMGQMGQQSQEPPKAFGEADGAMGGARDKLKENELGSAVEQQQKALDALRSGSQEMAQKLGQMLANRGVGRGQSRDNAQQDPLGRESGSRGQAFGNDVKVPEERDLQRAREILEELQRRAAERSRPQDELDYIERLLRRF